MEPKDYTLSELFKEMVDATTELLLDIFVNGFELKEENEQIPKESEG